MESNPEKPKILMPKDSHLEDIDGNQMLMRKKENFFLSNRSFEDTDNYFSGAISKVLDESLQRVTGRPLQVLDIGGGIDSEAILTIGERYGNRVHGINVDIAHDVTPNKISPSRIQADVRHLPLANGSIDVAYSRQVLPFLLRLHKEHPQNVNQMLFEISRVLASGGIAVLDDEGELSRPESKEKRDALAASLGVVLDVGNTAGRDYYRKFPKLWVKYDKPRNFLFMKKPISEV
jgi:ubiquinone/menaquinone biosynthesis C-methylase UbiE